MRWWFGAAAVLLVLWGCEDEGTSGTATSGTTSTGAGGEATSSSTSSGGGGDGGQGGGCMAAEDCPLPVGMDPFCATPGCSDGECVIAIEPDGTVYDQQTPQDCQLVVCDTSGGLTSVAD